MSSDSADSSDPPDASASPSSRAPGELALSPAAQRLLGWAFSIEWEVAPPPWPVRLTLAALTATTEFGPATAGLPIGLVRTLPGPAPQRVDNALAAAGGRRGSQPSVLFDVAWDQDVIPSVTSLTRAVGAAQVAPHHLLAAALMSGPIPEPVLTALGVTQATLMYGLRKEISQSWPAEPAAVWDARLGPLAQRLPGDLGALAMLGWASSVCESSPRLPAPTAVLLGALAWAEVSLDRVDPTVPDPSLQRFFRSLGSSSQELRQLVADAFLAAGVDRPTATTPIEGYAARLAPVLRRAEAIADETEAGALVAQRHLVAAALVLGGLTAALQTVLRMDDGELRLQLWTVVVEVVHEPPEGHEWPEQWAHVLGLDRLETAFATDYVPVRRRVPARLDQAAPPPLQDHLDVDVYVAMLAATVMRRSTAMPLSIGLFGPWGSGKSYFMELLRQKVDALATPGDTPTAYVSSVVQITFNAWNYADTNLWASLAAEFFTQLGAPEVDPDETRRASIKAELRTKNRVRADLRQARKAAARRKETARDDYARAVSDRERQSRTLNADLLEAVLDDHEVRGQLADLGQKVGLGDAPQQTLRLAEGLRDLSDDAAATRRVLAQQSLRMPLIVLGAVIGLFTLVALVAPPDLLGKVFGTGTLATVGTLLALGVKLVSSARDSLRQLRAVADRADEVRSAVLEKGGSVATRAEAVHEAEAEEEMAAARLAELNGALTQLERQLDELQPGRRLYQFIAERAASTEYRGQLGVVSSVRRDFEQLVEMMRRWRESPSGQQTPIDRIVLYVDDLDRCEPDQVVQVLQAVHLLLAMDLFVVVVGVDPNWLLQSLRQRYRGILDTPAASGQPADAWSALASTPQAYLEKIFQIPFALPRMTGESFGGLMAAMAAPTDLTRRNGVGPIGTSDLDAPRDEASGGTPADDPDAEPADTEDAGDSASPQPDSDRPGTRPGATRDRPANPRSTTGRHRSAAEDAPVLPPEAGSEIATGLHATDPRSTATVAEITSTPITLRELTLLKQMGPLVRSPRAATRLFNIYGIMRSATNLAPGQSFLGGPGQPGAYQAVAQLLGVLTADPELLGILLYGRPAPDGPSLGLCRTGQRARTWPQVVDSLLPSQADGDDESWSNGVAAALTTDEVHRWRRIHSGLSDLQQVVTLTELEPYRIWGPQIARFSFILSPQLDTAGDDG